MSSCSLEAFLISVRPWCIPGRVAPLCIIFYFIPCVFLYVCYCWRGFCLFYFALFFYVWFPPLQFFVQVCCVPSSYFIWRRLLCFLGRIFLSNPILIPCAFPRMIFVVVALLCVSSCLSEVSVCILRQSLHWVFFIVLFFYFYISHF